MVAKNFSFFYFFILLGVLVLPIRSTNIDALEKGYRTQKKIHIQFFMQDILSGSNATAVKVVTGPESTKSNNLIGFGNVFIVNDKLTESPSPLSRKIGVAQGFYIDVSQNASFDRTVLQLYITFVFTEGIYNGSTISIMGNDPINEKIRELSILSGTGQFRFVKGYILWSTSSVNSDTGDATLEANAFIYKY